MHGYDLRDNKIDTVLHPPVDVSKVGLSSCSSQMSQRCSRSRHLILN